MPHKKTAVDLHVPSSKIEVVLIRHGRSTFNDEQRVQGCCDKSVLTHEGRQMARTAGMYLSQWDFDGIWTSPLARALETSAEILSVFVMRCGRTPAFHTDSRLREVELPRWEGLTHNFVRDQFPSDYLTWSQEPHELRMDGVVDGDPVGDLFTRASSFWRSFLKLHTQGRFLLVTHAWAGRALISAATGIPPDRFHRMQQCNVGMSVLRFATPESGEATLAALNYRPFAPNPLPKTKNGRSGLRLLWVVVPDAESNELPRALDQVNADRIIIASSSAHSQWASALTSRLKGVPREERPDETLPNLFSDHTLWPSAPEAGLRTVLVVSQAPQLRALLASTLSPCQALQAWPECGYGGFGVFHAAQASTPAVVQTLVPFQREQASSTVQLNIASGIHAEAPGVHQ